MLTQVKFDRLEAACAVSCVLLALIFYQTIERQEFSFSFKASSLVIKKAHQVGVSERFDHASLLLIHNAQGVAPIVHAFFLLFDLKQNLRRWPVLAGDST